MRLLLAAMAVALLWSAPARAVEDRDDAALRRLDTGVAAYRAGDYAAALREFEAARRLVPDKANPYRWLGLTYVQLGDCTQALLAFETFLQRVPPDDERVAEVTQQRDACERAPKPTRAPAPVPLVVPAPAPAPPPAPGPPPAREPLAHRWWFWTALGGAAAVTAAGITLGVVFGTSHESRLPPIICGTTGCAGSM
ncbi:MAG TPA: tetratricopeptide repeat protein [Polyangia bacterium]|nr:tetratricopeptide repeat protein [Polyangia bacterium]